MNVVAIIQARSDSTRLPNKIFFELPGGTLLHHVIERLKPSITINKIVLATTLSKKDDTVESWAKANNITYYRGSELNVLERFYKAAKEHEADLIVRITADDPFKDYRIIDLAVEKIISSQYDFVCNNNPVSFPEGLDVEVLTFRALEESYKFGTSEFEKEHVTQYIHRNLSKFKIMNIKNDENLSSYRWTIDTIEDYDFVKQVYNELYNEGDIFLTEEIIELIEKRPELLQINKNVLKSDLYK